MKVLVTGATGFTGRALAKSLNGLGHEIRLLIREQSTDKAKFDFDAEIIQGDVRDPQAVDNAVKGVQIVFHIAALYRTAGIPYHIYYDIHAGGSENLLKASVRHSVDRFVHCSTVGVHGHIRNGPADESHPFNPGDIYQITKLEGERRANKYIRETNLPITIIRPCAIYGPGDLRLLKLFKLASMKIVPIIGSGNIFYHMVYIDDLVDAFILAAVNQKAIGEAFIIGGDERLTLNKLIDLIASVLNINSKIIHLPAKPFQWLGTLCERIFIPLKLEPPIYRRRVDFFTKSRAFDITKARNLLNYEPKVSIETGLAHTAEWYKKQGFLR